MAVAFKRNKESRVRCKKKHNPKRPAIKRGFASCRRLRRE